VTLFYNPGPTAPDQHLQANGPNSFNHRYAQHNFDYSNLASAFDFCPVTINNFINPKSHQLNQLLGFINHNEKALDPLFMDLIPWHSANFQGVDLARFNIPNVLNEFRTSILLPAAMNARNTALTNYANNIQSESNKIVFLAIGALYTTAGLLNSVGFQNVTNHIPAAPNHLLINNPNCLEIQPDVRMSVWHMSGDQLVHDSEKLGTKHLNGAKIFIINLWNKNIGMNIPCNQHVSNTLQHVLSNI
jgi:hypothetical protein